MTDQSLEYYLGQIELLWWGPLLALWAAGLWGWVVLRYLTKVSAFRFGAAVFLFLLLSKFKVLFFPPYGGDTITGPFAEAVWLKRHQFDYAGLLQQPGYTQGGAKVYMLSFYPTLLAWQMTIFSPGVLMLVNHLLTFALAAATLGLFRAVVGKVFTPQITALLTVAVISLPLFQSQVEMINMEFFLLFFTMLAAYFLTEKRYTAAGYAAVGAVLTKGFGIVACGAVFGVAVVVFLLGKTKPREWKTLLAGVLTLAAGLGVIETIQLMLGATTIGLIRWFSCRIVQEPNFYFFAANVAVFVWYLARCRKEAGSWPAALARQHAAVALFMFALVWYALFLHFTDIVPRYFLVVLPFLAFVQFFALSVVVPSLKAQKIILLCAIAVLSLGAYGALETKYPPFYYIGLERSLEYRNVLQRDIRLAKVVEKDYAEKAIVAPAIVGQMLGVPELGYVAKQLEVTVYAIPTFYDGIKAYAGWDRLDLRRTVWVGQEDDFSQEISTAFPFPVDPSDRILKTVEFGGRRAVIYQGGVAVEKAYRLMQTATKRRNHGVR